MLRRAGATWEIGRPLGSEGAAEGEIWPNSRHLIGWIPATTIGPTRRTATLSALIPSKFRDIHRDCDRRRLPTVPTLNGRDFDTNDTLPPNTSCFATQLRLKDGPKQDAPRVRTVTTRAAVTHV